MLDLQCIQAHVHILADHVSQIYSLVVLQIRSQEQTLGVEWKDNIDSRGIRKKKEGTMRDLNVGLFAPLKQLTLVATLNSSKL